MNKRGFSILIVVVILALVVIVGFVGYKMLSKSSGTSLQNDEITNNQENNDAFDVNNTEIPDTSEPELNVVKITTSGFSPQVLEIKRGEKVTWINEQAGESWPASASHPMHTDYPGSGITKCGSSEEAEVFDACHGLRRGDSYEFVFDKVGEWKYHDHLRSSWSGTIIVKNS